MNKLFKFAIAVVTVCCALTAYAGSRWSEQKANEWYASLPWMSGCNYNPACAINQIEMWHPQTFNPAQIDKELQWAEELVFNTMRVFLSSVVWKNDPIGFKQRIHTFLTICQRHGIRPMLVFFDDCWNEESTYGLQPLPKPGVHNSGWVKDPSLSLRNEPESLYPVLKAYMQDVMRHFANDQRVLLWDLYNEPGNIPAALQPQSMALLKLAFEWAREVNVSQPITSGIWSQKLKEFNDFQVANSDVISFHCYKNAELTQACIDSLRPLNRPLICTEYMARKHSSTFQTIMPIFKKEKVMAINWGFVAGKTNTIFAWDEKMPDKIEPPLWFHDILRQDASPFDPEEVKTIKRLNAK